MRTLRNAIDQNNVHHAYLFAGSRGTGKTSMAKILASALNCADGPKSDFSADDPAVEAIASGTSMDVVEMDAASHNRVDDIRDLIDSVSTMAVGGGWKVYILDEAHMVTPQGWNAFLKTLEEPPPHTVFVLATTEANKVLPTVADRCHRFDFRRPTVEQLSQSLRRVADAEGIEIGDDGVAMIARAATGSFRDALGTLEQLVTYGGKRVGSDDIQAVLGVADFDMLVQTAAAVASGDRPGVLRAVAELADRGRDMIAFARDFAAHVRNLLVAGTIGEAPVALGLTAEQSAALVAQAQQLSPERSAHTLDLLSRMIGAARGGGDARLLLELALFKAARPEDDASPDALIARIESLERQPGHAQPAQAAAVAPNVDSTTTPGGAPVTEPPAEAKPVDAGATTENETNQAPPDQSPAEPEPEPEPAADPPSLETVQLAWPAVVAAVHETSPRLGGALESARPMRIEDRKLVIGFAESAGFLRKTADQSTGRAAIAGQVERQTGFAFAIVTDSIPDAEIAAAPAGAGIDTDELVARLKEEFDATEMTSASEARD